MSIDLHPRACIVCGDTCDDCLISQVVHAYTYTHTRSWRPEFELVDPSKPRHSLPTERAHIHIAVSDTGRNRREDFSSCGGYVPVSKFKADLSFRPSPCIDVDDIDFLQTIIFDFDQVSVC